MADSTRSTHPDSAELQKYADDEIQDDELIMHVESCATCREEIAAVRRVTAALSLTSKSPDSLSARIHSRRADHNRVASPVAISRSKSRVRGFILPVGLAAAAMLVIFAPRALREESLDVTAPTSGAKGMTPSGAVFETVLSEWSQGSIDSAVQALDAPGTTVELRYVTGRDESARAQVLADSIAGFLRDRGVAAHAITVRRDLPQPPLQPLRAGAVGISVRSRPVSLSP
ncbi:MAG: hypothetical protein ABIV11_00110 [Gemmatimonadaceae bacterium]